MKTAEQILDDAHWPITHDDKGTIIEAMELYSAQNVEALKELFAKGEWHVEYEKKLASLRSENEKLKNDLLDALDLKTGNGPTALTMLSNEISKLKAERQELVEALKSTVDEIDSNDYHGGISLKTFDKIKSLLDKLNPQV